MESSMKKYLLTRKRISWWKHNPLQQKLSLTSIHEQEIKSHICHSLCEHDGEGFAKICYRNKLILWLVLSQTHMFKAKNELIEAKVQKCKSTRNYQVQRQIKIQYKLVIV